MTEAIDEEETLDCLEQTQTRHQNEQDQPPTTHLHADQNKEVEIPQDEIPPFHPDSERSSRRRSRRRESLSKARAALSSHRPSYQSPVGKYLRHSIFGSTNQPETEEFAVNESMAIQESQNEQSVRNECTAQHESSLPENHISEILGRRVTPGAIHVAGNVPGDASVHVPNIKSIDMVGAIWPSQRANGDHEMESATTALEEEDLAEAMVVNQSNDAVIVTAIEHDPNKKHPSMMKSPRCRLYALSGCCILIAVVIAAIFGNIVNPKQKFIQLTEGPTQAPSPTPTTYEESHFRSIFADVVGDQVYVEDSPQDLATKWILEKDPMKLDIEAKNLIQRYVLAVFYFHTTNSGKDKWTSCNPPVEGENSTCEFLEFQLQTDNSFEYVPVPRKTRWLSDQFECNWEGVDCAGGSEVLGLEIFGQNLRGTLPTEINALTLLQKLVLPYNKLSGSISTEFAHARYLQNFQVHGNLLTGTIPNDFFLPGLNSLITFNVGDNVLSGTLSTTIGNLEYVKGIHIFENYLSGTIPTEISKISLLTYFRIQENDFTGMIPTTLGNLTKLAEIWFSSNLFIGMIPTQLRYLTRLKDLRLDKNIGITGHLPEEIWQLTRLHYLHLQEMNLSGSLSTKIGLLTNLRHFAISNNFITGTIPTEMTNLSRLRLVWMHLNQLSGSLPIDVCNFVGPKSLSFLQTDCFPIDNPPVECLCCTACCDPETKFCDVTDLVLPP